MAETTIPVRGSHTERLPGNFRASAERAGNLIHLRLSTIGTGIVPIPFREVLLEFEFEFDDEKSRTNARKHGIDFIEAQILWTDPERAEVPARTVDEPRWMVIGRIAGITWSAVITYRGDTIRLISVRRSRKEEITIYER
ncbi:MAG: BrnT family toxin [Actinobacteria bacterium]|nr:BrnT family toxin [Actinomycetota bacterium]